MARKVKDPKSSEVDAYVFIKKELKTLGWDVRNPARQPSGQVYTQAECLSHPEIKKYLVRDKPENVIKINETVFWVIEAKNEHKKLAQAVSEAIAYAEKINRSKNIKALFVSGVAGNEIDSYLIETHYLTDGKFKPIKINDKKMSALISSDIAKTVLSDGPDIEDIPVDETFFLAKAEEINRILHLGAINKTLRAKVMAALLLALVEDNPVGIDSPPSVLIGDINNRAQRILKKEKKSEFYKYIELQLPATEDNHIKFKTALVKTIQELNNLNIRSAMNSGTDVLGKFYEVFLKYGNGAKEIGIVLTPRHITKFAVETLNVTDQDYVYDPTCGTGGFLVAAFDRVRQNCSKVQVNRFKKHHLFGVDQETEVVALAIVNMIFRGDGKNNIVEGDCFQKNLVRTTKKDAAKNEIVTAKYSKASPKEEELLITKVLMNPPFALPTDDEKEFKFVDTALRQMQVGGLLFSVLPYSAMVKPGAYLRWRRDSLLTKNTLLAVITFPEDLFCPIGVHTVGIFVKKGIPHSEKQNVLWIRALNDGLLKSKGKRLPNPRATNDFNNIHDLVKAFTANPAHPIENEEMFQKACPIDYSDPLLELVPENYLDQAPPTKEDIKEGIEQVIRDSVSFLIQERMEDE